VQELIKTVHFLHDSRPQRERKAVVLRLSVYPSVPHIVIPVTAIAKLPLFGGPEWLHAIFLGMTTHGALPVVDGTRHIGGPTRPACVSSVLSEGRQTLL